MLNKGDHVSFAFTVSTLADPYERRTGTGTVIDDANYSVWPLPGYSVRVQESDVYPPGTVISVSGLNLTRKGL